MILSAQTIRRIQPIKPFHERTAHNGLTFGLSAAGYDIRVAEDITLWPHSGFSLASSLEEFDMPEGLIAVVHDKSTWARRGLAVQNTVIEPGWRGFLTLELSNNHPWWKFWKRLHIKAGDPIAQILFHKLDSVTEQPYDGRYQDQEAGPQEARLLKSK